MTEPTQPRRLRRVWMPVAILLLAIGGMTALVMADALEPITQFYIMMGLILGTPLLLVFWALFLSGVRWWQRLALLLGGAAVAAGLIYLGTLVLEIDGAISGSGIPRLRWKWKPPVEAKLDELKVETAKKGIELSTKRDTDYPQFLGRDRDGVAHGVRLARDWKAQVPQLLWRQSIGLGCSGFAVAGEYAITQEQREDRELVVCYELKTGKVRWKHEHDARFHDKQGGDGPRATPTIVGERVYTLGATGLLDCIDGATGKNLWSRNTLDDIHRDNLIWGVSCSPLVLDDKVIVTGGQIKDAERKKTEKEGPTLLAYDRETGKPLWTAGDDAASYSSPAVATLAGKQQILSVNAHSVTGHDPESGKVLWNFAWSSDWAKASQPVPRPDDRVFLSAGYGIGCVMLHVQRDAAGQWKVEPEWEARTMRTQFSNVVIARNYAFGLDDRYLACIDLATGERRWKGSRYNYGQVIRVGDLLLVQVEEGPVALVEANPDEFRELGRIPALKDKTWNTPVLSGPYLLVRNDKEAACYQLPVETGEK